LTPARSASAWRRWTWFLGIWAASVLALGLVAGGLKLVFGAILK
jgi:hypothetical protein